MPAGAGRAAPAEDSGTTPHGRPAPGYPWPWSVGPWIEGTIAAGAALADPAKEARRLDAFLAALHVPAPDDAPRNPHRGHFIGERTPLFVDRVEGIAAELDDAVDGGADRVLARREELIDVAAHAAPPTWVHGDLHTANVLVHDGWIAAVIDFGDLCAGDPATDLAVSWMLSDEPERPALRSATITDGGAPDDQRWQRGEAWALRFALTDLAHSAEPLGPLGERHERSARAAVPHPKGTNTRRA